MNLDTHVHKCLIEKQIIINFKLWLQMRYSSITIVNKTKICGDIKIMTGFMVPIRSQRHQKHGGGTDRRPFLKTSQSMDQHKKFDFHEADQSTEISDQAKYLYICITRYKRY